MRVDILSFHCTTNYGATLQAYALREALVELGCDAGIVNYTPRYLTWFYGVAPIAPLHCRNRRALRWQLQRTKRNLRAIKQFRALRKSTRDFIKRYLRPRGPRLYFAPQLCFLRGEMRVIGSDQIWNPGCTLDRLRAEQFGGFRGPRTRRAITYAASMGSERVPDRDVEDFRKFLPRVDAISLREASALPFLKEMGRDAAVVCDPTLLFGAEKWRAVASAPPEGANSYILLYVLQSDPAIYERARELARRTGLPLLEYNPDVTFRTRPGIELRATAGPSEFLGALMNARYVLTNSFHGSAFSAIFHRPFLCYPHSTRGRRMLDLLRELGLEARLATAEATPDIDAPIDWADVDARRAAYAERSRAYLREQIAACGAGPADGAGPDSRRPRRARNV